jgi:hypothetical protein
VSQGSRLNFQITRRLSGAVTRLLLARAIIGLEIISRITPRNIAFSSINAKPTEIAIPVMSANIAFTVSTWSPY